MKKIPMLVSLFCFYVTLHAQHKVILDRNDEDGLFIKDASDDIHAGDTVLLKGRYTSFAIYNIKGTRERPIVFINKGPVLIGGNKTHGAIFSGEYFKILGNGDKNIRYGICFSNLGKEQYPHFRLKIQSSKNIEIAFCDISNAANGIIQLPGYGTEITDCYYHDNYFHQIGKADLKKPSNGINLGAEKISPDTSAYSFKNCRIENNLFDSLSGNAVAVFKGQFDVDNNYIKHYGLAKMASYENAILLGTKATGEIKGNIIDSSSGTALMILGYGDVDIEKNSFTHLTATPFETLDIVTIKGDINPNDNASLLKLTFKDNIISGTNYRYAINDITPPDATLGSHFSNNKIYGKLKKIHSNNSKDTFK